MTIPLVVSIGFTAVLALLTAVGAVLATWLLRSARRASLAAPNI